LIHICENPNCNLPANHKGDHSFICKKAWEAKFTKDDIDFIISESKSENKKYLYEIITIKNIKSCCKSNKK